MCVYCIWVFWLLQFLYVSYVLHYSIFRVWCIVGLQCAHSIQCGDRATGKRGSKFPLMCAVPAMGGRSETGWKQAESMTVADQSQKKDYVWKQHLKIKWNTLKYMDIAGSNLKRNATHVGALRARKFTKSHTYTLSAGVRRVHSNGNGDWAFFAVFRRIGYVLVVGTTKEEQKDDKKRMYSSPTEMPINGNN